MDAQSGNLGTVADQNDQVSIGNRQDLQGNEEIVKKAVLIDFTNSADSANDESAEEAVIIDFTNSTDSAENNEEEGDPRTGITKNYLEFPGDIIKEGKFAAHKELIVNGAADGKIALFSAFWAATLEVENQSPFLIELGDSFNDYIFITCIYHAETSDLKLVFIKSSWLEKCPPVGAGIEAMKTCDGNNNNNFEYMFSWLS
jgi:hypothetical protein